MFKNIFTSLLLCCCSYSFAQLNPSNFLFLSQNGDSLPYANIGGLDAPQYSAVDLNNDNKLDLLVYDRVGKIALTFLNIGAANQIKYEFAPDYMSRFPQGSNNLMLARDFNNDGIADLFYIYQRPLAPASLAVMRGSYDANNKIQFTQFVDALMSYNQLFNFDEEVFISNPDIPMIDDIDNDGDMDLAAFTLDFTGNVMFYKNHSVEQGYGADSLILRLENNCLGQFSKNTISVINSVTTSGRTDSCGGNAFWRSHNYSRHGASGSLSCYDFDGDGIKDFTLSDAGINAINELTNTLIADTLVTINQDTQFPAYSQPINLFSYPVPYFLDINNDGIKDMIVGNNEGALGPVGYVTDSTTHIYLNNPINGLSNFSLHSKDFIYSQTVDVGNEAHPVIADVNADGLPDLIIGNRIAMKNNGSRSASLYLFINVGVDTQPVFRLSNTNYANIASLSKNNPYPTFADINGDGSLDLLVGFEDGTISLLLNQASANQPFSFAAPTANYNNINVGASAAPQLFDLDKDGDFDLLIGENSGVINYFENTGTNSNAVFANQPTNPFLGQISLNVSGSFRCYPFFKYDSVGNTELYMGNYFGNIIKMGNIDNNLSGKFDTLETNYLAHYSGGYAAVTFADLNNDSIPEMIVGNARGGVNFYSSRNSLPTNIIDWSADLDFSTMYPNPVVAGQVNLVYANPCSSRPVANVYTIMGQLVQFNRLPANTNSYRIDVSTLKKGIYMLEFIRGRARKTYRLIIN
jgi:Secretion system C-terminal sorting domain/FG-GAP-like repeat